MQDVHLVFLVLELACRDPVKIHQHAPRILRREGCHHRSQRCRRRLRPWRQKEQAESYPRLRDRGVKLGGQLIDLTARSSGHERHGLDHQQIDMELRVLLRQLDGALIQFQCAVDVSDACGNLLLHSEGRGKGGAGPEGLVGEAGRQLQIAPVDEAERLGDAEQQHGIAIGFGQCPQHRASSIGAAQGVSGACSNCR